MANSPTLCVQRLQGRGLQGFTHIGSGLTRSFTGGFTIIELMVGIAIFAILLAIGVPSFMNIIRNNRVTTGASNLVAALNYARMEAIKRGDPVSVCSSTGATCTVASTDWKDGWIAFTDSGGDGQVTAGDVILQVWPAVDGGLTVTASRALIQYTSNGMPNPIPAAATPETFDVRKPGCTGNTARLVSVTLNGRVASAPKSCT